MRLNQNKTNSSTFVRVIKRELTLRLHWDFWLIKTKARFRNLELETSFNFVWTQGLKKNQNIMKVSWRSYTLLHVQNENTKTLSICGSSAFLVKCHSFFHTLPRDLIAQSLLPLQFLSLKRCCILQFCISDVHGTYNSSQRLKGMERKL